MKTRPFGFTGRDVAVIGQGTWKLRRPDHALRALDVGLGLGLTHIDTAELYTGSEQVVGRAIKGRRDEVFLVSKVLPHHATYEGTLQACAASLQRLGTDHLDTYLLHWWDTGVDIEGWARAMNELRDDGSILHVGVSNLDVAELVAAQDALGDTPIVCDQVYYDLEHREIENELLPVCAKNQIAIVDYSPFGSGQFPGPATRDGKVLAAIAQRHGATPHQVALNFLTRDPNVFAIPKAESEEHVRANAAALEFTLTGDDLVQIEAAFPRPTSAEVPRI
jgi:diketogulonate reductase-like aldo/keto reductase